MRDALLFFAHLIDPFVVAAVVAGVQLHPVEQIVNVQWGGLAVIFGEEDKPPPEKGDDG